MAQIDPNYTVKAVTMTVGETWNGNNTTWNDPTWNDLDPKDSGFVGNQHTVTWTPGTVLPEELTVCQICGVEEVVVFCEECKGILKLARQKWAETVMEEIEDALS